MYSADDGSVNFGDLPQRILVENPDYSPSSVWNYHYEPNQIFAELSNVTSLQLFEGTVSASRKQMFGGSHLPQMLVFKNPTARRIFTGQEFEYGKATFTTKVERHAEVIAIIPFYNEKQIGLDTIKRNPEEIVILEYQDDGEIDYVSLKEYFTNHQYFGFKFKGTDAVKRMHSKRYPIAAGTVLQDSPSKTEDGNYNFGIMLNAMYATFPEAAEDGILISDEIVPWLATRKYEKRTVTYGSSHWATNQYGTGDNYQPFPNIGEYVREDGLLMVTRPFNENFSAVEMSDQATREVSHTFDKSYYVSPGRGKVVDVRVILDPTRQHNVPKLANTQALKYDQAARVFHRAIYDQYRQLVSRRDGPPKLTPAFRNLVKHSYAVLQADDASRAERVQQISRAVPMDDVTIEFVIEYEVIPTTGFKFTDLVGGKGVVVKIVPRDQMPVDAQGNRAQIVMDSIATVSRQNVSRLYEQFFNACSRDLTKEICALLQVPVPHTHGQKLTLADKAYGDSLFRNNDPALLDMWQRYLQYVKVITPTQRDLYDRPDIVNGKWMEHMWAIAEDGIYLHTPTDNDPELPGMIKALKKDFMPFIGPVTYFTHANKFETTVEPILIGQVYYIMLEKTGDDCSAVSSGKLQGIGILAHLNNKDKYTSPWREQSIRFWGETESAIGSAYLPKGTMPEIFNRNNSIPAHRAGVYTILRADKPTDIPQLIDRDVLPITGTKPVELINHLAVCGGWEIGWKAYVEMEPKPAAMQFVN